MLNKKLDQSTLKSIYYVRRSQNQAPFMASIELKPYINPLKDKSQFVQILAPYSKNQINLPGMLHHSHNQYHDYLRPNYKDNEVNQYMDSTFNVCIYMLLFLSLGCSIIALVFYGMTLDQISYHNNFDYAFYESYFSLFFLSYTLIMFLRFIIHFGLSVIKLMSTGQRVSLAISFLCPLLKYHLIIIKPKEFRSSIKGILITDVISTFLLLFAGIFNLVTYMGDFDCYYCGNYRYSIFTGIFLLIEMFLQISGYLFYRKFLKQKLNEQKNHQSDDNRYHQGYISPQMDKQVLYGQNHQNFPRNKLLTPIHKNDLESYHPVP